MQRLKPLSSVARKDPEAGTYRAVWGMLMLALFAGGTASFTGIASAGTGIGAWDSLIAWVGTGIAILVGVVVLLYTMYRGKKWSKPQKYLAYGLSALFLIGGFANLALQPTIDEPNGCDAGQVRTITGECIDLSWDATFPTTVMGTPRDVITEIGDSDGADCDAESPTPTLAAYATNAFVDRGAMTVRWEITVDYPGVANTVATWSAPDVLAFDVQVLLKTPVDANGDGTNDQVPMYGRVQWSKTSTVDGNGTSSQRNIFYGDTTWGSCAGIFTRRVDTQATDGTWTAAWDVTKSPDGSTVPAGTASEWVPLGSTNGADVDFVSFAAVSRNYGFYGFTLPQTGDTYTGIVDFAGPGYSIFRTVRINVELQVRA